MKWSPGAPLHRLQSDIGWAWGVLVLLGTLFLLVNSNQPAAQDLEAPIAPFRITEQDPELVFEFDYFNEKQSQGEDSELDYTNTTLQQYLYYRLRAYVYHPRFLDIHARLKLGLLEQWIERSGGLDEGSDSSVSFLDGYDIYLYFLRDHPILSATLFANRDEAPVLQLFTDLQTLENERQGFILNWKHGPFPMDFSYSRTEIREKGIDSYSQANYDIFEYTVRNQIGERIRSELRYRYTDYMQQFRAENRLIDLERETELQSHDVNFLNTIYLDDLRRSYLTSSLRYFTQSGTTEFDNYYWRERLNLRHTKNFSTYYLVNWLKNELPESTVETWTAEAGLEYQLYESLRFHFDVHGRWTDFDGSSEDEVGVTGRIDYRKRTPWGLLTMGYGRTIDKISRSGRSVSRPIIDEQLTLDSILFTFLSEPGVIPDTIVVTDPTGTIEYVENFDYITLIQGQRVGLRVLPGGTLNDGDTVLVDYEIIFTQDIDYRNDYQTLYARYAFERYLKNLAIYYRWQQLEPSESDFADDLSILSYDSWLAGFEYRWRWLTWREEYQEYRSNFSEYDQLDSRLEAVYDLSRRLRLSANVGMINVDYLDDVSQGDQTDIVYAGVGLDGQYRGRGYWRLEGRIREETGLIDETLMGLLARTGYSIGKTRIEAGALLETRERFDFELERTNVFLQVRREF